MTLANIMKLAMRQLDEAAEDIAEYEELFRRDDRLGDEDYTYLTTVVTDAAGDHLVIK